MFRVETHGRSSPRVVILLPFVERVSLARTSPARPTTTSTHQRHVITTSHASAGTRSLLGLIHRRQRGLGLGGAPVPLVRAALAAAHEADRDDREGDCDPQHARDDEASGIHAAPCSAANGTVGLAEGAHQARQAGGDDCCGCDALSVIRVVDERARRGRDGGRCHTGDGRVGRALDMVDHDP